ncbi:MAG: hypothetical protein J0I20_06880 [Chloroflexi bacterium]|nr:hypothetical protein [Chloroflexota bacterium]
MGETFKSYSEQGQAKCPCCNGTGKQNLQPVTPSKKPDVVMWGGDGKDSTNFIVETFTANAVNAIQEGVLSGKLPTLTDIYFGEDNDEFLNCNFVFEWGTSPKNYKKTVIYILSKGLACREERY